MLTCSFFFLAPGADSSSISQQRPHKMENPVCLGYLNSTGTRRQPLSSNHLIRSSQSSPRSARSSSSSMLRPSYLDVGPQSVLPCGENRHLIDMAAFAQPLAGEPSLVFGSHSLIGSNQSEHEMLLASNEIGDQKNPNISAHCGPLEQPLNLFPRREHSEPRETSEASRGGVARKGDECDMELNPQMVDSSKGLVLNESALQLLQCNHFISRVSSLCGESIVYACTRALAVLLYWC